MSYLGVRKQFKDFPVNQWIKAAGKCQGWGDGYGEECDAPVEVKIVTKDDDGEGGYVRVKCFKGHETEDFVGWTVGKDRVSLGRLGNFFPILARSNLACCAACGLIIVDIPLILWGPDAPKQVEWELDFCWECAEKLKILDWMRASQGPATTMVAKSRAVIQK